MVILFVLKRIIQHDRRLERTERQIPKRNQRHYRRKENGPPEKDCFHHPPLEAIFDFQSFFNHSPESAIFFDRWSFFYIDALEKRIPDLMMKKSRYQRSEKKTLDMENTHDAILRAAIEVFMKQGYENGSMDEIAKKAKTAKGTLYNYFGSKKELIVEIAWNILQSLERQITGSFREDETGRERVVKVGRNLYSFLRENRFHYDSIQFFNSHFSEIAQNDPRFAQDRIAELLIQNIELGKHDKSITSQIHPLKFLAYASSTIWGMLMFMRERGAMVCEYTQLTEEEMVDYCFQSMERALD